MTDRLRFHVEKKLEDYEYYDNGIENWVNASGCLGERHHVWNEYDNNSDEMCIFRFNDMKHEWNEYDDNGDDISTFGFKSS